MTRLSIHEIEAHYPVHKSNGYSNVRAYWVPISLRETLLNLYREAGIKVRIRYRGSRIHSVGREMPCIGSTNTYRRTRNQANQDCLRDDATHFTVYAR